MQFDAFTQQSEFLTDKSRIRVLFAAKRSGKSEPCYIDTIIKGETQEGYVDNGRDPYLMAIIAPTNPMLKRLVWPKFRAFAKPFEEDFLISDNTFKWKNKNTIVYGVGAEKIKRIEGLKINHIHITEVFQMSEHVFYEALARTADTKGTISIEGSLGTNLVNPKNHWAYKMFKEQHFPDSRVWEWATADNPYFPADELERLRFLNPRTFRQLFEIDWNVPNTNSVYGDFCEHNLIKGYVYDPRLETSVSIDWGWSHPMAVGFYQYDKRNDTVYKFDEIVKSKMSREELWAALQAKPYKIDNWYCDIAGKQTRESAISNINWFKKPPRNVHFKYRSTKINYGVPIVRQYIKNGKGQCNFYIDEIKCPKSVDGMRNYCYDEKNGIIQEEPKKENDDCVDETRYYFVNRHDFNRPDKTMVDFPRWGTWQFSQSK